MPSKAEGQSAIDDLNGKELKGKALNVNEPKLQISLIVSVKNWGSQKYRYCKLSQDGLELTP